MGNGAYAPQRPDIGPPRVVTPFPVIITVLYLALTAAFMALPALVPSIGGAIDPIVNPVVRLIAMVILGVIFLLVIISSIASRPKAPATTVPAEQRPSPKPVQAIARPEPQAPTQAKRSPQPAAPRTYVYPDMVEGGIYGDTYIKLEGQRTLKLRTQVVGPEHVS
ncbi:MAG: hypothetical protein QCI82_02200 [Candidatus Thermoplasmatota archaeon]|nr:hypothetical protein [Candidatus Thermoplasmatota archaeon]